MEQTVRRPDLPSLTAVRAVAALVVFVYHLHPWTTVPALRVAELGYTGVTVFFVLSGFILTWTHRPQLVGEFYWQRLARIYPTYAVTVAAVVVWSWLSGNHRPPGAVAANVVLVHAWSTDPQVYMSVNGVTWSLSCEVFFYALFPALIAAAGRMSLRTLWWVTGGLFTGYAALTVVLVNTTTSPVVLHVLYANPAARLTEFVVGIAAARTVIAGVPLPRRVVSAALLVAVFGVVWLPQWPAANMWATPLAAVVIAGLAWRDLTGHTTGWRHPVWQFAGRASYAFYLVHRLILLRLEHHSLAGRALIGLVCAVAAAVVLHLLVEVPANRWLTRRYARRKRSVTA